MTYEDTSWTTPAPSRPDDGQIRSMHLGDSEVALRNGSNANGTPYPAREPVTVPAHSDLENRKQDASPPRASVKGKPLPSSPSPVAAHQICKPNSPGKVDDVQQMDTSLEGVDNDAEEEEDAEAELLEAVNAAEEAARALRERSK